MFDVSKALYVVLLTLAAMLICRFGMFIEGKSGEEYRSKADFEAIKAIALSVIGSLVVSVVVPMSFSASTFAEESSESMPEFFEDETQQQNPLLPSFLFSLPEILTNNAGLEGADSTEVPFPPPNATNEPSVLPEDCTLISGHIDRENQVDTYLFTANSTGKYGFVSTCADGAVIIISVKGNLGNTLSQGSWLTTVELEAKEEYQIEVAHKEGFTNYEVKIFASRSDQTIALDKDGQGEFFFEGQYDKYRFISSEEGFYTAVSSLKKAKVYICNEYGAVLGGGTHGKQLHLDANTAYYICVESHDGQIGPYIISVYLSG